MTNIPEKGDIVWLYLEDSTGREQTGRRPVIVISSKEYHNKSSTMLICPITSNSTHWPWKYKLPEYLTIKGYVLIDQLRSVDRIERKAKIVGKVDSESLANIIGMLKLFIEN